MANALIEIRQVTRASSLNVALSIGEIVLRNIFGGNVEALRAKGRKEMSFRRLAGHDKLPVSASYLWRCVAVYDLSLRVALVTRSSHLGVGHVSAVLSLPQAQQEDLLTRADREWWSVDELRAKASSRRNGRGGRPPKLAVLKAIDALRRVASLSPEVFSDEHSVRALGDEDVDVALETLKELESRCRALKSLLSRIRAR